MTALSTAEGREKLAAAADIFVVATAVSLPWSTTAAAVFVVLWMLTLAPTLHWTEIRRDVLTPAGGLPVLLVLLGVAGCAWADVSWFERWKGFDSFVKLLAIPFLLTQFRRSERGAWVFAGYLFSCVALVMASFIVLAIPALADRLMHTDYVLVKNAATQSGEFVTCIFGLLYLALARNGSQTRLVLFGIALVVVAMLASIFYVATGRTALVVFLILLILFATRTLPAKGIAVVASVAILVGGTAWISSPYLRGRTQAIWTDLDHYAASYTMTSSGERLVFWTKSIDFIRQSPFAGHGTGSIHSQFQKSAAGQTGAAGEASTNPHNQTFAVGIQLGLVGIIVLWAMWIAHLAMFRGDHLVSWIGVVVVIQNVVGSLFNSHLFDFVQGWTYVVGVGVAGGMMLGAKRRE